MQGKHLFLRCRDKQNHAGTWTAAITAEILSPGQVRDIIEPRCNINEAFAQEYMADQTQKSTLRLYHPTQDMAVITRSFWTTDRLTEALGRKGVYSVSCILTDQDAERFSENYSGAFNPANFETYDELLRRTDRERGLVTVGQVPNLFSSMQRTPCFDIFKKIGLTSELFSALMEGVYASMLNNGHYLVILPESSRLAWETSGNDDTAELFAEAIMALLPPKSRSIFGFVTHWGNRIDDRMIDGMHLTFVHEKSPDGFDSMKRESTGWLDLDNMQCYNYGSIEAPNYFQFLWDNLTDYQNILQFWSYANTFFEKLLTNMPANVAGMECVFLFYQSECRQLPPSISKHKLFLLAARVFAGSGTAVPKIENYFLNEMSQLLGNLQLDSETEEAVLLIATSDRRPTLHQETEYQLLFGQILIGQAQKETIDGIGAEPLRLHRKADKLFVENLREIDPAIDGINRKSLFEFLGVLLENIFPVRDVHRDLYIELLSLLSRCLKNIALADTSGDCSTIFPLLEYYLRNDGSDSNLNEHVYSLLFRYENIGWPGINQAVRIIQDEEMYLCSAKGPKQWKERLLVFAKCFFSSVPFIITIGFEKAQHIYPRMYHLMCTNHEAVTELAKESYEKELEKVVELNNENFFNRYFFPIQKDAFQMMNRNLATWSYDAVSCALEYIEQVNLKYTDDCYLETGDEHTNLIIDHLRECESFPGIVYQYLSRLHMNRRQALFCEKYRDSLPLESLYIRAILDGNRDVMMAIRPLISFSYKELLQRTICTASTSEGQSGKTKIRIQTWFMDELTNCIKDIEKPVEKIRFLGNMNKELSKIHCLPDSDCQITAILKDLQNLFSRTIDETDTCVFLDLLPQEIRSVKRIHDDNSMGQTSNALHALALIHDVDDCHIEDSGQPKTLIPLVHSLDTFCYGHFNSTPTDVEMIHNRIKWWATENYEKSRIDLFRADALFVAIMKELDPGALMKDYKAIDIQYDRLSAKDQAEIVLKHLCSVYTQQINSFFNRISTPLLKELERIKRYNPELADDPDFENYYKTLQSWSGMTSFRNLRPSSRELSASTAEYAWTPVLCNTKKTFMLSLVAFPICLMLFVLLFCLLFVLFTSARLWVVVLVSVLLLFISATSVRLEWKKSIKPIDRERRA